MISRQRRIRLFWLAAAVAMLLGIGTVGALIRPPKEADQVIASRFGDVSWNHDLHVRRSDIANCQVCHHKERQGVAQPKPCRECHKPITNADAVILADLWLPPPPKPAAAAGEGAGAEVQPASGDAGAVGAPVEAKAPPPMTAFHAKCTGCHRAMKQGPVICRDCHAHSFSGAHGKVRWDHRAHARQIDMGTDEQGNTGCQRCHHQDKHAKTDADYRPCGLCHKAAATLGLEMKTETKLHQKILHRNCKACHTLGDPSDGLRTCKDCHAGLGKIEKPTRPAIEQAVHAACGRCHNEEYPALTDEMPTRCEGCHLPDQSVIAGLGEGLLFWDHDRHARFGKDTRCDTCHHTDEVESPHMACRRCHGTGVFENPPVAEALRRRCIKCHVERDNGLIEWDRLLVRTWDGAREFRYEDGERSFSWSHRDHAISYSLSCRNCHHPLLRQDGASVTATRVGKRWGAEATHPQSCRTCHGPEGAVAGSPAEGTKAPAFPTVFKRVCIECHKRLGGGPQAWEDYFKVEPTEIKREEVQP